MRKADKSWVGNGAGRFFSKLLGRFIIYYLRRGSAPTPHYHI
jgi:hypothetical protein